MLLFAPQRAAFLRDHAGFLRRKGASVN